ncbi:hypothetical protein D1007_24814 [Hordeum vulgare]|uniref:Uncharacterized protein n=1 Tax=Hordeum vulgare subsp. vulgare TaxID=112509 RepID=A0A8I6YKM4_HORVV|nr:uncharacterized protein LOC123449804 [Hordeum vulgare subsp. vulgare]KAE8799725.1 hypothetical protein D1007_24814 [Hordeum vulgare]
MATTPARQSQGGGEAVSVQHVAKASSDELLRKFADPDDDSKQRQLTPPRRSLALRRKRSSRRVASGLSARDSGTAGAASGAELAAPKRRRSIGGSTDWRAGLLLPTTTASSSSARKGTASHARRGARLDDAGVAHFLAALERTWKKTVAGASRMFVERHRSSHVQLISDMV